MTKHAEQLEAKKGLICASGKVEISVSLKYQVVECILS